ncbi:MAG: class I SAM-dependent methyltransferase, partial [Bacteroidetes bacterium]|nr:class I SAM-dependent methyltransferase [Bacteroidota bacterium]
GMKNKETMEYWVEVARNRPSSKSVKVSPENDFTDQDSQFILKHASSQSNILDLASGSGLIINKIKDKVGKVIAVEKFPEFSKFIDKDIRVVNADILEYVTSELFEIITMFGIAQYFSEDEVRRLYSKYYSNLKAGGKFIIKNQFGVKEDVLISGFSKELQTNYFSHYRMITKEIQILMDTGFQTISINDIYPAEFNRWSNTHFYAIVCEK